MRSKIYLFLFAAVLSFSLLPSANAQDCVRTGLNNIVATPTCCGDLVLQIPDLKSTSSYAFVNTPYNPFPYTTPGGTFDTRLYDDDTYSNVFNLPFPFCFFDNVRTQAVISSNGLVTLDIAYAGCPATTAAYAVVNPLSSPGGGADCSGFHYPRESIMGIFMDLDPRVQSTPPTSSPADRKIEWRVEGTAPCRRFVISFYHIGVYQTTACSQSNPTTFQIILYESTGLIDIMIENQSCMPFVVSAGGNTNRGIMGLLDATKTQWAAAPGKNATVWPTVRHQGFRFVPSGGASRFVSSELLTMALAPVAVAASTSAGPGILDITFPNLCTPGTPTQYIVRTTYSACENPASLIIGLDTITIDPQPIPGDIANTATTCGTATDGTITVTPTGGTAPFTFTLDTGTPQTGTAPYTFTNVPTGPHYVVITDATGCVSDQIHTDVPAGSGLTGNNVRTATSCSGATNGTITVTPTNGTAPFTFTLDTGTPQTGTAPYTFTNVPAGPHYVVITDASGCVSNQLDAEVAAGPQLATTANATPALCNGSATGTITVAVPAMGTAPYQYSLDNVIWQASNVFNGLAANNYTVYYQSADGCTGSTPNVIVTAPASVSASNNTTPVTCNGLSDGIINVTANGGVGPYQYSNDGGANWQSSNIFTVPANIYNNILVRDANNCTAASPPATVTEPAVLTASANTTNATCNGGSNGTITVTANGGNAGYQYSLDGVNFQSSNVFNVAASPTAYTVTIRDNLGCTTTATASVGQTNDLTFTPQTDPTICEGTSTQLQLVSNAIQYSWTPTTDLSDPTIADPVANPAVTTTYTVTATLGACTATDVVTVNVNPAPVPDAGPGGFICYGQTYQLQGSGGTQYTWTPSTYLNNPNISNPVSTPSKTITYTLSEVTDAIGCKSIVTDEVTVDVTPAIKVTTFPFDTVAYAGDQFQLNAISIANIYTWSPATGLSNPNIANPVVTAGPIGSEIMYQVIASTAAGCTGEGYVKIKVYTGPDIYVPTGFSPNNDGNNDKFIPFPVGINSIKYFRVFNRGGQLVFSTTKLNDGWDGKLGGIEQPTGVYVWMVEGVTKDKKVITKKGTVTLIR